MKPHGTWIAEDDAPDLVETLTPEQLVAKAQAAQKIAEVEVERLRSTIGKMCNLLEVWRQDPATMTPWMLTQLDLHLGPKREPKDG